MKKIKERYINEKLDHYNKTQFARIIHGIIPEYLIMQRLLGMVRTQNHNAWIN